ncbi:facilitated trehalose transporter Tret1-like isoform X2 [Galleria mellonella]|uniref:Facilitated trehalose transporter Tret1-like isoform X2 n=1 Tax=Galleria mellonella TaxID=7137 RepID=A0ABM3MT06_GALME|nr:facilitated trehalose transporter Tret1-like isoform X2 [Galleria mellonella]
MHTHEGMILIASGALAYPFMYGLSFGSPTVLIPQLRREANSTAAVSDEMESWLSSSMSYGSIPAAIILTILADVIGRKRTCLIVSLTSLSGFLLYYFTSSLTGLLISQSVQGVLAAAQITTSAMVMTEYISPQYRGVFLNIKGASLFWGIWVSNAMGTFLHWKTIGLLGLICAVYSMVTVLIWPESPYWLSAKGRYDECTKSHRWLKGSSLDAEKELKNLIAYKVNDTSDAKSDLSLWKQMTNTLKTMSQREIYKPILVCLSIMAIQQFSGKYVWTVYSIEIIKKITNSESTAYIGMLTLDGVTIGCMYTGCFLTKRFNRRVLLLAPASVGVALLFLLSLYLYLIKLMVISENNIVTVLLLTIFSIAICIGPINIGTVLMGELIPLKCRTACICLLSTTIKMVMATVIKVSPYLFRTSGYHGAFLFYAISTLVIVLLVYKYLPETKDKTLVEIAETFRKLPKTDTLMVPLNDNNKL